MLREDGESSSFIDSRMENYCRKESSVPVLGEDGEKFLEGKSSSCIPVWREDK